MFTCYPIRKASFYSSRSNKHESLYILYVISEVFFLWYSILSPGRSVKERSPSPPQQSRAAAMQQALPPAQEKLSSAQTRLKKIAELHCTLNIAREGTSRSVRSRELSLGYFSLHFSPSFVPVRPL